MTFRHYYAPTVDAILSRSEPTPNGCRAYYGSRVNFNGRRITAARIMFADPHDVYYADPPRLIHTCGNSCCVNPEHLRPKQERNVYPPRPFKCRPSNSG